MGHIIPLLPLNDMTPTFQVQDCPIFIGSLAATLPAWLEKQQYSQVFVLCDQHTEKYCLPYLVPYLVSNQGATIEPGETSKNLASCEKIWQAMLQANLDRKALVLNLGGGVIGDIGGFCAATWKRGIDFIHVPTTLLSMTDAAIGGKTGIDFHGTKNTIGVFEQPAAVFADPFFLQTLPDRELRSGFAEVIKHALIGDPVLKAELMDTLQSNASLNLIHWPAVLQKSIAVKVHVVQEDPLEKGLRMLLNFGHTIGHALESLFLNSDEPLTHGEAVYIGMICEAHFLSSIAIYPMDEPEDRTKGSDLQANVTALGRHVFKHRSIPTSAFPELWALMLQDKKNLSGTVRMAVPDKGAFSMKIIVPSQSELERSLQYFNGLN